jgi:predicted ATP-dependent protease
MGGGEVVDIEREVDLGGPLHSKGMMILSGYLMGQYVPDQPLSLAASIVFEQSYHGVDGDSASSAELYALLSALAQVPIRQSLAVTGALSQLGEVQAIGGVNEKIEGFFELCDARGLTGEQGVLIPESNVKNLMLRQSVVDAVRQGKFHIYPIQNVHQGIECLTGLRAGQRGANGRFPKNTLNGLVEQRLIDFAEKSRSFHANDGKEDKK